MENRSSAVPEQLLVFLTQRIEDNRADLASRYLGILREALFSSSANVRPSELKKFAADEVDALLNFLKQSGDPTAKRGEQLHQTGFKLGVALRLSQITRQFLLDSLENDQVALMLGTVDTYELAVVEGFLQSLEHTSKIERIQLEHVLNALHKQGND